MALDPLSGDRWHVLKVRVARKKWREEEDTRRAAAIWRARVSVHYPRPKYEYKSGWIRVCISGSAFHPESSKGVVKIVDIPLGISFRPPASSPVIAAPMDLSVFYNYHWLLRGISTRNEAEIREGLFCRFFPTFRPFPSIDLFFSFLIGAIESEEYIYKFE